MKFELDKEYMKKIKYFTLGFVIVYSIYALVENLNIVVQNSLDFVSRIIYVLMPLVWGTLFAYLLMPIVKFCCADDMTMPSWARPIAFVVGMVIAPVGFVNWMVIPVSDDISLLPSL